MTAHTTADETHSTTIGSPETLRDREDVPVVEDQQVAPPEAFEGIRATYADGGAVVAVGVTDAEGRVLLQAAGAPAPIRGDVAPDEDPASAARRVVAELTGATVAVGAPVLVEFTEFRSAADEAERFTVATVHVRASLAAAPEGFRAGPRPLDDPDHKYHDDGAAVPLGWHDDVPDDVHPNHEGHVERYLG